MPECVLVLEDEILCRDVACAILERAGYRPLRAACLDDCLRHIAASPDPVTLLVADQILPGDSGASIVATLARQYPDMKFLFVSGTPPTLWSPADRERLAELPKQSVALLAKPFRADQLIASVHRLLGHQFFSQQA